MLAFALGAVVVMPIAGHVIPGVGTGRATRLATPALALSLLLPFAAPGLATLAAAAFVMGLANGSLDVAMNAHASLVERRWAQPIMSSFHAAFSAGGLAGAATGGLLAYSGVDPALALPTASACVMAAGMAGWRSIGLGERTSSGGGFALPGRAALPVCIAAALCMLCEGAMADWSGVYLSAEAHASDALAAGGFASFSAAMVVGRLCGDRLVRQIGRSATIAAGGAVAFAGLAWAVAVPLPWAASLGFSLVGLGLANIVPVLFSMAGALGASPANGIAMAATTGYAGFLLGPPVIGAIATASDLRLGFAAVALCAGLVPLVMLTIGRSSRSHL